VQLAHFFIVVCARVYCVTLAPWSASGT
jgi:hypothetical protein